MLGLDSSGARHLQRESKHGRDSAAWSKTWTRTEESGRRRRVMSGVGCWEGGPFAFASAVPLRCGGDFFSRRSTKMGLRSVLILVHLVECKRREEEEDQGESTGRSGRKERGRGNEMCAVGCLANSVTGVRGGPIVAATLRRPPPPVPRCLWARPPTP